MNPSQKMINNILSIDVESHIQKLASKTYSSPDHYPVELIRSALQRGANRIEVLIKKGQIVIQDNGSGILSHQLEMLRALVDPNQSTTVREKVIEDMMINGGIGLLAVFSPSPERISIENVYNSREKQLLIHKGQVQEQDNCNLSSGTRIILFRKNINWDQEGVILRDYCKFAPADIFLNGESIEKKHILSNSMVSIKMTDNKTFDDAWVGIPKNGDICRIWFLNQKIPWYHTTISPWNGFVFEAAVETNEKLTPEILNQIARGAHKLYQWLATRYATYPYQTRVEEIIFKHHRLTGNQQLLNRFTPFKIIRSNEGLSVSDIQATGSNKAIYAIPINEDPSNFNTINKTVLLLSNAQTDFLINHLQLPITFLSPVLHSRSKFKKYLQSLFKKWRNGLNKIHFGRRKIIQTNQLTPEEALLIQTLPSYHSGNIRPLLIDSRGLFPSIAKTDKNKTNASILYIRKKHPLVKKAIHAIQKDPENIEIVTHLFGEKETTGYRENGEKNFFS